MKPQTPIVYKTVRCWVSKASSCHTDTDCLVRKANAAMFITESTINYLLKVLSATNSTKNLPSPGEEYKW